MNRFLCILCLFCAAMVSAQPTYPRLNGAMSISTLGSANPYDFTQVDVRVALQQPDGSVFTIPAFYDGDTTWRIRHTPTMPGIYTAQSVTLNGQPLSVAVVPSTWNVTGIPTGRGFVKVDPTDARHFMTGDGHRFFPVGHDVAWDIDSTRTVVSILLKMGADRENWARIWMDDWDQKNLDWGYPGPPLGTLSLTVAQKWDGIIAAAEQAGVEIQMTLQHHGQYSSSVDAEWPGNPYNAANGGFLSDATQFFTNATAIAYTERKLRYAIALWGYSPAIMGWELFNEVQFTDAALSNKWSIIESWHNQMAAFLRQQDSYHHLITSSSDLTKPIWDSTDYYTHHDYPNDLITDIRDAPTISPTQKIAPVYGAECGVDFTPRLGETATAFAGLMAAQSGAEDIWYWDFIDTNNDYVPMRAAADFAAFSGLGAQSNLVKSAPAITSPQSGPLSFSPGGGWASNTGPSVFTVGQAPPDGMSGFPGYLQGVYHRTMTPNGLTLLVNYPQAGIFSAQVLEIASSGAALNVKVDGASTNVVFPSAPADVSTNFVLTLNVAAGLHTITLTNGGLDWIELGYLTLNPYVPMIGGYQVSNPKFSALWLWHHTNIYLPTATATATAQATISGLEPGAYNGTWWDPAAGVPLGNISFTQSAGGQVVLNPPAILRSIAFYAGHPPAAQIVAPALSAALGTNAPWLTMPLSISNSGGLPLGYSIAISNASPLVYSAITSQQSGGPSYAWKDISGVGIDLTTNLTALTGKSALDEGIAGPVPLGFSFPFFNSVFSNIYVSPNGFVTFSPFAGDTSTPRRFPSAAAPTNCVGLYWCDLTAAPGGHIYAAGDPVAQTFTVQYNGMTPKAYGGGSLTGQIILKSTGEIALQYQSIGGQTNVIAGVQNAAANQGFVFATNVNTLRSSFAILMSPALWLRPWSGGGLVNGGDAANAAISLNAAGLAPGNYTATLNVNTSDSALAFESLPVSLNVAARSCVSTADCLCQFYNESVVVQDVNGALTVSFRRPSPAPASVAYRFDTATNVAGPWTALFPAPWVATNGDGTETVSFAAPGSSQAYFLRAALVPQ